MITVIYFYWLGYLGMFVLIKPKLKPALSRVPLRSFLSQSVAQPSHFNHKQRAFRCLGRSGHNQG
ncbi:hypothetical protein BCU36_025065 (plasmid) [Vibrio lentus]|uniref:hypothetical protein n=1 Tax=Vibrio lentus TaxID=136468 RepID=UPI000C81ACA0|nr:hypothetical protein BCU36_11820 [Vibrio lentus]PMJ00243.1 hypothetical protein BCU32_12105 [Vibrio lentus]